MRRKVLSVVLCVCMMMTMAPFAFAAENSGTGNSDATTPSETFDLTQAIQEVQGSGTIEVPSGTYTLPNNMYAGKTLTIKAAPDANVAFNVSDAVDASNATITFENVTFNYLPQGTYKGLQHASKLTYNNCTINGLAFLYAQQESFTNCTFNQTVEDYNIWCYGSGNGFTETFTNCTFNGKGKFLNVYRENSNPIRVNLTGCKFINSADTAVKSAVNVKETCGSIVLNNIVSIDNCTVDGQFPTDENGGSTLYMVDDLATSNPNTTVYVNSEKVWENGAKVEKLDETNSAAKITTSDGTTYYKTLADAVTAASDGQTIKLIADTEVASAITIQKNITLDLNGQKITSTVTPVPGYLVPAFKIIAGGSLNVTGKGTIDSNNKLGLFNLVGTEQAASEQSSKLVIGKDVTVCNSVYAFAVNRSGANHSCNVFVDLYGKVVGEEPVYVNGTIKPDGPNAPEIRIHDSAVFSMQKDELYLAGYAKTTIENGATLTNPGGNVISIAAGELTVNGGTFIGGDVMKNDVQGTGGAIATSTSSAIFVKQHTTNQDLKVNINGGIFKAAIPFYQATGESGASAEPDKVQPCINGGYFYSTRATSGGTAVKSDDKACFIFDGYFNTDPSKYCGGIDGQDLTGIANTTDTKADYPWTVGVKGENAAPVVSSSLPASVPEGASKELKDTAAEMTEGAEMTSDAIEAAVASTANDNNIVADATHAAALNAIKASIDPDITVANVKIVYQTYVDMQLTDVKSTPTADELYELTVNLTPKYRVIATTEKAYETWENGEIELLVDGDEALKEDDEQAPNSVLVQDPQTLNLPDAAYEIVIPLPSNFFAANGDQVSVKHEKQNGTFEYYTGTVTEDTYNKYVTFTTNGFSPFTISAAAAFIGNTAYPTFQEAVDAAQNNDVITLVNNDAVSATMSGASRTITVKAPAGTTGTVKVTVNGETKAADTDTGATFTYTRPSHSSSGSTTTSYNVNVTAATNGTVTADKKTAAKGATVTVTATPAKGYVVEAVKVVDKDGKDVAVTAKDGKYVFTMPGSAVTVTASFKAETPAESGLPFVDVKNGDWFYDAVKYAYENGLMTGTSATTFAPNGTMNRAMIVTVLYRLEKSPAVTAAAKFTDVPAGQWYSDAVAWAAANGIVNGYDETTFGPMNAVTREQLAAILFRYEQVKGLENVTLEENLNRFPDKDKISAYAVPALQWAVGQKVINGNADGTLDPTGTATRAQVAQILMNLLK